MSETLTRVTHRISIQMHPVTESCTICSSRSRRPVRKLLDTPSYTSIILPFVLCDCETFFFILRDEYRAKAFQKRVMRIFRPKREEVAG
jgi:hypothetical protein